MKNPGWWKKVSGVKSDPSAASVDAWASQIFGARLADRKRGAASA